ncbi:MAG: RNA 3'-terminal phosphate cyclase [Bryobacterales bacterium]|nr:RNA 3'-terminal phosphate cyclase [Bryobacteraceae bacterium]MDW8355868.1 RNA 3'-terminal phosphate cyclase [Bryobacterales bacterium]
MIEIDGSLHSGSGTVVRQAVAFAALTGRPVHLYNVRARRDKPGLQPQHLRVVEAICEIVGGQTEGVRKGAVEFVFRPGPICPAKHYLWDIGSAGSTTLLALAVLPLLAFAPSSVTAEIRGGLFQDFAPSVFHLQHVMLPLLARMGLSARVEMRRPGYVPRGGGILVLTVEPVRRGLDPLVLDRPGPVERITGIALASHLADRDVAGRMARTAHKVLAEAGHRATIEERDDRTALQPGAALALFADLAGAGRLGADWAGAPGRTSEAIGRKVARQLLEDLATGATLDRFAADQIIPFAALARGESRFRVPSMTDHMQSNVWLASLFLGTDYKMDGQILSIRGAGFEPPMKGLC